MPRRSQLVCQHRENISPAANSNVTALIAPNGVSADHYESVPSDNLVSASGSESTRNPFRFSTRSLDNHGLPQ